MIRTVLEKTGELSECQLLESYRLPLVGLWFLSKEKKKYRTLYIFLTNFFFCVLEFPKSP